MKEAEEICDRVAIMHKGKIIAIGSPSEVKSLVKSNEIVVVDLAKATPELIASIKKLEGVISVASTQLSPEITRLKIEVNNVQISSLIAQTIVRGGGSFYSMKIEEPTLEDALIKLTGEK